MTVTEHNCTTSHIMSSYRESIDAALAGLRPFSTARTLENAIEYAVLSPGKRLRPITALVCGETFGRRTDGLMSVALAVELLHAASIVYDDLPCMDNTMSRRNRPSLHQAFSRDIAVLCAHSLVSHAFYLVSRAELDAGHCRSIMVSLSRAIGPRGMAAGQVDDLKGAQRQSGDTLRIAACKTAPLFQSAGYCGALAGGANKDQARALGEYGLRLGFAFQVADDFADEQEEDDPDHGVNVIHEMGARSAGAVFAAQLEIAESQVRDIAGCEMLLRLIDLVRGYCDVEMG